MNATPSAIVLANCTHLSLALALRKSGAFSSVESLELYSLPQDQREARAEALGGYDFIVTLLHGPDFGPLSTAALKERFGDRVLTLPTPFFSGLTPDMSYLKHGGAIARAEGILGDYHSGLLLAEFQDGRAPDTIVDRYESGRSFDRLDVEGVWADSLAELKRREADADLQISDYIEARAESGRIGEDFLSFNHPTEGLINHIAGAVLARALGSAARLHPISSDEHNLYRDAFWPIHPVVAERLGLPRPAEVLFKAPARLGAERFSIRDFAERSVAFFAEGSKNGAFEIATPWYLKNRISSDLNETTSTPHSQAVQPKQIVLSHFGRSGSTVLSELLRQHSKIAWLGEFFSLKWIHERETYNFTLEQLIGMIDAEVARIHGNKPHVMVGHEIKLMNFLQNPSCNMMDYARATADGTRYVHIALRRRNVLKRICSVYKAAQTKVYHLKGDDTGYRDKTFSIDFNNLIDFDTGQRGGTFPELIDKALEREEQVLANFRNVGIDYLELTYEDDIEGDPLQAYAKVVEYLGLEHEPAQVSLKKTSAGLEKELKNYDQLEEQMRDSLHAWMLS